MPWPTWNYKKVYEVKKKWDELSLHLRSCWWNNSGVCCCEWGGGCVQTLLSAGKEVYWRRVGTFVESLSLPFWLTSHHPQESVYSSTFYCKLSSPLQFSKMGEQTWEILQNLRIRGGKRSSSLASNNGISGLWSVSIMMCFPRMKSENFSQAHVVARASFSICAYRSLVSVIEWEAKATGFHVDSDLWSSTTPRPYADASADIFAGAAGL